MDNILKIILIIIIIIAFIIIIYLLFNHKNLSGGASPIILYKGIINIIKLKIIMSQYPSHTIFYNNIRFLVNDDNQIINMINNNQINVNYMVAYGPLCERALIWLYTSEADYQDKLNEFRNEKNKRLTRDIMKLPLKYVEKNQDFINVMETNKEYKDIIDEFHYNPIDYSHKDKNIFTNVETYYVRKHINGHNMFDFSDEIDNIKKFEKKHTINKIIVSSCDYTSANEFRKKYPTKEFEFKHITFTFYDAVKYLNSKYGNNTAIFDNPNIDPEVGNSVIQNKIRKYGINQIVLEVPEVNEIENYGLSKRIELIEIIIPTSVTKLGDGCFSYCNNLTNINLPTTITKLSNRCFEHCTKLSEINISESVVEFGNECFMCCSSLININIPTSVTKLGDGCFLSCKNLTKINISSRITSISAKCFEHCNNLSEINISESVVEFSDSAFYNCSNLAVINMPSNLKYIGNTCFSSCNNLAIINIPAATTFISEVAFMDCNMLTITINRDNPIYKTNDGRTIIKK